MSDYYFIVCQDCGVYKPVAAVSTGRGWRLEQSERNNKITLRFFRRHHEHELVVKSEGQLGDARREEK
jgi:hypothetical protein